MARRTKGFTAKQSARTSRRMQNSTVGSHVSRSSTRGRTRTGSGADSVSFSNSRGQRRAARGQVDALLKLADALIEEGVALDFDQYPYLASATPLSSCLPGWVRRMDHSRQLELLADPGQYARAVPEIEA